MEFFSIGIKSISSTIKYKVAGKMQNKKAAKAKACNGHH
jgi:hypothetical protein